MTDTNRLDIIFERMLRLFDINSSSPERTVIFKQVKHDDLCDAIIYWIEQSKLLFGEVVWVQQIQSRQDEGVDIVVEFPNSEIKIGFQIKSSNDIKSDVFSSKVDAQITKSKKHGLSKYFITFAGDLTDKSQNQKTRIKMSNLSQLKDDYVVVIPPEKLVVIYEAFKNNVHPLKFVETDFSSALIFAKGISESLSNEYRKTEVTIFSKYLIPNPEDFTTNIKIDFKFKQNDVHILDEIERVMKTGDELTISKDIITNFDVTKIKTGESLLPKGFEISEIKLKGMKGVIPATTILKDEEDKIIDSRKCFFNRNITEEITELVSVENDNPLLLGFVHNKNNPTASKIFFKIDSSKGDALKLHNTFNFISNLSKSKKIEIEENSTRKLILSLTLTESTVFETESFYFKFVEKLAKIQLKTSQRVFVPENVEQLDKEEIKRVFQISHSLELGKMHFSRTSFIAKSPKEEILKHLEKYNETKKIDIELETNLFVNLFNQVINLGRIRLVSGDIIPKGNIEELIASIKKSEQDEVEITFESTGDGCVFQYLEILT